MPKNTLRHYRPLVFGTLTVGAAAVGIADIATSTPTAAQISQTSVVELGPLEDGQCRYRVDNTAPTASVGHLWEIGTILTLDEQEEIINFKVIRTGATSGTAPSTLYR